MSEKSTMSLRNAVILAVVVGVLAVIISSVLANYGSRSEYLDLAKITKLINKTTNNQVTIIKHFPALGNLEGVVVQSKDKVPQVGILYVDRTGEYLISGAVITAKGENLAQKDYEIYVQPQAAVKAFKTIGHTEWIAEGKSSAPHKMYVVMDPNCIFCHRLYEALAPKINSGALEVRWIIVGMIKPSSAGKAKTILGAKDPLAALKANEAGFNEQNEEGAVAVQTVKNNAADAKFAKNMKFATDNALTATPATYFKTRAGVLSMQAGMVSPSKLSSFINNLSDQF